MKLFLADGTELTGNSFGADIESEGEVVFTTGMTGYLEILTDPSYFGQIVVFTFPLIGNYGVFPPSSFPLEGGTEGGIDKVYESSKIWVRGVILTEESKKYSHELAKSSFSQWLKKNNIPALSGIDTRALTQILREHGTVLGKIGNTKPEKLVDELNGRFVPEVSPEKIEILEPKDEFKKTIAFMDCGTKNGIFRNFLRRGIRVIRLPFNQNPFSPTILPLLGGAGGGKIDGLFISNGPGDPERVTETIEIARQALDKNIPIFLTGISFLLILLIFPSKKISCPRYCSSK